MKFKIQLPFLFICVFLFAVSMMLGVWQLQRYHYKKNLVESYSKNQMAQDIKTIKPFQWINVKGQYQNDLMMLVQNRFYHDQVGFEVLTPLKIMGEKKLLLVDRGWTEKSSVSTATKKITKIQNITGYVKFLDESQFILGKNILETHARPIVMQKIELDELTKITGQTFYPFILRLDPKAENGFVRDWIITSVSPDRHLGYAVQWFLFGLILLVGYSCFIYERKHENE